jgi:hypothetical protein
MARSCLWLGQVQCLWPVKHRHTHLTQCEDVGSVAWFVHECMEWVDNSHTG